MRKKMPNTPKTNTANNPENIDYTNLIALRNIFNNLRLPKFEDFQKMVEKQNTHLAGGMSMSSLYYDWPKFYELKIIIKAAIHIFYDKDEKFAFLKTIKKEYQGLISHFEYLKESKPDPDSDSIIADTDLYQDNLNTLYKNFQNFIAEIQSHHLPYIRKLLATNEEPQKHFKEHHQQNTPPSAAKERNNITPEDSRKVSILTDRQQEVWNLLENNAFVAKAIAKKIDSTEASVRQIIVEIRNKKGKNIIKNTGSRGYWRPDAPPK